MPRGTVKRKPGRPPGAKNKPKSAPEQEETPPLISRRPWDPPKNSTSRKRRPTASFLQVSPKHLKLIQKWSNDTKIGQQQVLDDIMLAGASAVYKSFYRGLINSRKAAEEQFDAETNTEVVDSETVGSRKTEEPGNGYLDPESPRQDARLEPVLSSAREQLSLASIGSGYREETDIDLREFAGIDMAAAAATAQKHLAELYSAPPDASPTTTEPEEEGLEEEPEEDIGSPN